MNNETKAKIKSTLRDFDFEKVRKAMVALDWRWSSCEGVPSVAELYQRAEELLHQASERPFNCSTGGFKAIYFEDEGRFEIVFILAVSTSDYWEEV